MKNLIDELHKLDNYEYKVSEDFSKKVMKRIKKSKTANKFNNVISLLSIGAVACLAVVMFNNSNVKSNIFNFLNKSSSVEMNEHVSEDSLYYDTNATKEYKGDDPFRNYNEVLSDDLIASENDLALNYNNIENEAMGKDMNSDFAPVESVSSASSAEKNTLKAETANTQKAIEQLLKQAGLKYKISENNIKIEATKEKVVSILEGYDDITLEVQGKYVIIKF